MRVNNINPICTNTPILKKAFRKLADKLIAAFNIANDSSIDKWKIMFEL